MSKGIEKIRIYEKIQESYIRWSRNVEKVANETGYPLEYVQSVIKYLVKQRKHDDRTKDVVKCIYENLAISNLSDLGQYNDMLERYYGRSHLWLSMCCKTPYRTYTEIEGHQIPETHECMQCHKVCEINIFDRYEVTEKELQILSARQDCFTKLVNNAKSLGYVISEPVPPAVPGDQFTNQNVLIINDSSGEHRHVLDQYSKLDPIDAERVIKLIETKLMDNQEARQELEDAKRIRGERAAREAERTQGVVGGSTDGGSRNAGSLHEGQETSNPEGNKKV